MNRDPLLQQDSSGQFAARWLFTVFAVAATAWFGLMSGRGAGHVPAVWWANSVLLAIALLRPQRERFALLAAGYCGNVIAHFAMHDPLSQVALLSLCDTAETTFALVAVAWSLPADEKVDLTDRSRLVRFVLFAVLLAPLLAACFAAVILKVLVDAPMITAFRWFPPSALGMAIIVPLVLGLSRREVKHLFAPHLIMKTLVYLSLLAATTLGIFSRGKFPLLFLIFPPLMFLVVELGVGGGALGACVVAAIGSIYTISGQGTLARGEASSLEQRILILQMFLATAVLSVDVVGLVLGDLKRSAMIEERAREQLSDALDTIEKVARVDATTRIANRRRLDEVLEEEWQRAIRQRINISLLLLDVDHFKNFNDRYGHLAGDECLRVIADIMNRTLRRSGDLLARFGGEEFAIVLPNTDASGAYDLAEQVRLAIRSAAIGNEGVPDSIMTVSVGIATAAPRLGEGATALLAAADRALYSAKRGGRDRVEKDSVTIMQQSAGLHPDAVTDGAGV